MFDFPKYDRKEGLSYKKHFLRAVIFQLRYDDAEKSIEPRKNDIINILKPSFPRVNDKITQGFEIKFNQEQTPILHNIKDDSFGIEFRSGDGKKIIVVDKHSFTYTIDGKNYKNFETLIEELNKINQILKILKINSIKRIAIRKINIIEFDIDNIERDNPTGALEYALNPDLVSNLNYHPQTEYIRRNIQTINYQKDENRLNLTYGLIVLPSSRVGQVIIDIDLFSMSLYEASDIFSIANNINNEIFNIFHWAISKNIEELLEK